MPRWIVPASLWIALVMLFMVPAQAMPMMEASEGGVRIVLTDEQCALGEVANLPYRATWTEKGKTYEGCYSVAARVVVLFFAEDKTVVAVPVSAFHRVTSA